jgi:hypothetical protein
MVEFMRVLAVCERLWLVKKVGGKLIRNSFEIPHETLPSKIKEAKKNKSDQF